MVDYSHKELKRTIPLSIYGKSGREVVVGIALSLSVTLIIVAMYLVEGFEWLELRTYDLRIQYRGTKDLQTPVLMVMNDSQTIEHLGIPPSKVSRTHYAKALHNLDEAGAALIVFDVMLSGKASEPEDQALRKAIQDAGKVILARYISEGGQVPPLERFQTVEIGEGLINVILDGDGVLRSIPLIGAGYDEGTLVPYLTLGAEAARLYVDPQGTHPLDLGTPGIASLGSLQIPYPNGKMLINFYGPPGTFPHLSLWQAVKGDFKTEDVQDKIVLIGSGAPTLHDHYQTPYSRRGLNTLFDHETIDQSVHMTGIETHANVIETILQQNFLHRSPWEVNLFLIGALGVGCGMFLILFPKSTGQVIGIALLLIGGVVTLAILLFEKGNYWLDMVPLIAIVNSHFAVGMGYQRYLLSRQKNRLERMFSHFVSPQVADLLWSQRTALLSGVRPQSQTLTVTTVLGKLKNFSLASEKVDPRFLLDWTNSFLEAMGRAVMMHGGVIEEYGDGAIKAHFGAPQPRNTQDEIRSDSQRAAQCAMAMGQEVERVNTTWKNQNFPALKLHIAMYTGPAVAGSVGCTERLKYTILGEAVQKAIIIQEWDDNQNMTLGQPSRVLAGETTVRSLDSQFATEKVGEVRSDENNHPIGIYQLFEMKPPGQEATLGGKQ